MAYDRHDTRDAPRDERSRWRDEGPMDRDWGRDRGDPNERGFFERAGDEVASWFGDEDAERRRREDHMTEHGGRSGMGPDRHQGYRGDRNRNWYETRGLNERGGFSERDYNPRWQSELGNESNWRDRNRDSDRERGYRPLAGDYGRSYQHGINLARGGRGAIDYERDFDRSQSPWALDEYRRTSRAGTSDWSDRSRHEDPHYDSWRQRHMNELDRDYDDYRRENQSRFEDDFGSWRERRQQKRGLLGQIREHMEVVGKDGDHVGTVDKIAGDRIILTKSDPDSGGVHHSLSCSDIDRVEGDRVILDCSADEAHRRWRDESRNRTLFERDDQGEMGPRMLNRSFEGTYRE